jgi:hypothetical protein
MKLLSEIEDQRIEEAFAKKTYGGEGIKFSPRKTVYYATLEYGRGGENTFDGSFSAKILNDLIDVWREVNAADKVNDFDKLGHAEEELDRIVRNELPDGWRSKAPASAIAEALASGRDIEKHTRDVVAIATEELLAVVSTSEANVHKLLFDLMRKYPA